MAERAYTSTTIRTEGGLLPADLLQRIAEGRGVDGLTPASYCADGTLNEAISRAWNALQGAWASFRAAQANLPADDRGTSLTRERWLLPLFRELGYERLQAAAAVEIDGRSYPISHHWQHVPIHLVSFKLDLDKRTPGVSGAASASPHSLVQTFLNRCSDSLWGFVSNGYKLRLLRDSVSLTRQAYVEFDLEAMMEGEVYSDFVLLWLVCHQSRVKAVPPTECWLERWMHLAQEQGTRALDQLRSGVEEAITALGVGFLEHPSNAALRDQLTSGQLSPQDYYRQLLRLVYRLLFLFVAEDRELLLDPRAPQAARERYLEAYSARRLRRMAQTFKGTRHADLFEGLRLVMRLLSGDPNRPEAQKAPTAAQALGLMPLGSFLFSDDAVHSVIECQISNQRLLDAVRALSQTYDQQAQAYRSVDYKNLGADELGSVFESLLELHPQINVAARTFALKTAAGSERKTTGSYYTPEPLVHALLDEALNPLLAEATRQGEAAILRLKVCDPACGSGHFLIAAANRIARALASVRSGEEEPPPAALQEAKRAVIRHCIYGVDLNPMAVELCKVNLWLEALEPGKPLAFLDHRILVGNSLIGTTPRLMAEGIPNDAFEPIEGDDKKAAADLKKRNQKERKAGQHTIFELFDSPADYNYLSQAVHTLDAAPDDTLEAVRRKEAQYAALASDPEYVKARLLADAWCAAFVWDKATPYPLTDLVYRHLERDPLAESLRPIRERVVQLADRFQFFHWHIAFPDVFMPAPAPTPGLSPSEGGGETQRGGEIEGGSSSLQRPQRPHPQPLPLRGRGEFSPPEGGRDRGGAAPEGGRGRGGAVVRAMATKAMRDIARELRQRQTPAEVILWEALRKNRLNGLGFRRQHPIANTSYVVDFFCYSENLVVELDGEIHQYQQEADAFRQKNLEDMGYKVLRFPNERVYNDLENVLVEILAATRSAADPDMVSSPPPPEGEGSTPPPPTPPPEGEGPGVGALRAEANPHTGWRGGFDLVLGNPPWERIKIQEKEWFAERHPEIASAPNAAARKRMIDDLKHSDPHLHAAFLADQRKAEGKSHFVRTSGRFPLCGRGDVNTYSLFAELMRQLIRERGRVGAIVPSGIATDDTTKFFFQDLVRTRSLVSLYHFDNREKLFKDVGSMITFCLLTLRGAADALSAPTPSPSPSWGGEFSPPQGGRDRGGATPEGGSSPHPRPLPLKGRGEVSPPERDRGGAEADAVFAFFLHHPDELSDRERVFTMSAEEIALINPNTGTAPIFRTRRDAEITKAIYRRVPVLIKEPSSPTLLPQGEGLTSPPRPAGEGDLGGEGLNPWGISFLRMFDMSNDSHLFRTRTELEAAGYRLVGNHFVRGAERFLPLYEAKMMHQFTHRWATYTALTLNPSPKGRGTSEQADSPLHLGEGLGVRDMTPDELRSPHALPMPRYWVDEREVAARRFKLRSDSYLAVRRFGRATDERTLIAGFVPAVAVGDSATLLATSESTKITHIVALNANLCAMALDFVSRQKISGVMVNQFILEQLPVLPPHTYTEGLLSFVAPRVLELTYTAWDMQPFARDLGYDGPPFVWDQERRFLIRCELDALYFHLYQISREDVDYILETFPIVKRKDEEACGEYRTKRVILEMYDQMAALPKVAVPAPTPVPSPSGGGGWSPPLRGGETEGGLPLRGGETEGGLPLRGGETEGGLPLRGGEAEGGPQGAYLVPDVSQWQTWLNPPPADPRAAHPQRPHP